MGKLAATMGQAVRALATAESASLSDRDLLLRFASDRDQCAFASVVARHAAMVLGVCRRALPRSIDADDVCQAVFLLLARKAGSNRWQPSIANWLYSTARKVAHNARISADRRTRREARAAVPEAVLPTDTMTATELMVALDEELDKLPPRYREPLVLCYLEGLTRDEAAARLGLPAATLKSQINRGRKKLAAALSTRGWEPGVVLLAAVTASGVGACPPKLRESILAAASGSPSDAAVAFAQGVAANGALAHAKAAMLVAVLVAAAVGFIFASVPPVPAQPTKSEPKPLAEKTDQAVLSRIGTTRFRATQPIGDARYSFDGTCVVGGAGSMLYVWNVRDGSTVRTMETHLETFYAGHSDGIELIACAVHPKKNWVACGGIKDGKTHLQIWDFNTGQRIAEKAGSYDALKVLAWTPDGQHLLERANIGYDEPTGWKLVVRNAQLDEVRAYDLPGNVGLGCTVMQPLPGSKRVLLWQAKQGPVVFDLDSGKVVDTINYTIDPEDDLPADLALSPDGKSLLAASTKALVLLDFPHTRNRQDLPIVNRGWWYRPRFSPDGGTVYAFDGRLVAFDVATGMQKWKATFHTLYGIRTQLCDIAPDGATLLVRHRQALSLIDAKTGADRDAEEAPSTAAEVAWSPDGKIIFTRTFLDERTWTAWEVATGKRLYDVQPTGYVQDESWQMRPDLLFLHGGRELLTCLERRTPTGRPKDLLVFDAVTGRCLKRLGEPLTGDEFRRLDPIGIDDTGATVLLQAQTNNGFGGDKHATMRWDPVKRAATQKWIVEGFCVDWPRHFAPYNVVVDMTVPDHESGEPKPLPAKVRCHSLTDGKLIHELQSEFCVVEPDRAQGNLLLTESNNSKWITKKRVTSYASQPPYAFDLWELPSREKVQLFELAEPATIALGPGARYLVRVIDDHTLAVHEPLVLKRAVVRVTTASRPKWFEWSPDGSRLAASLADTSIVVWDTTAWRQQLDEQLAQAVPADLATLWDDLAKDAATGLRAARLLSAAGDKAVALLGEKTAPKKALEDARFKQWIEDLDSLRFAAREQAQRDLRALSGQAEAHLRRELRMNPSAEVKQRIEDLLKAIEAGELTKGEKREIRAVQALEWMNTEAAQVLVAKWAKGDPVATLTKAAQRIAGR